MMARTSEPIDIYGLVPKCTVFYNIATLKQQNPVNLSRGVSRILADLNTFLTNFIALGVKLNMPILYDQSLYYRYVPADHPETPTIPQVHASLPPAARL